MRTYERRLLQFSLKFHAKRPTILRLIGLNWKVYVLLLILFGAMTGWFAVAYGWTYASYVVVAFVAVLLRDLGYFLRTVRAWPLLDRLIDWQKAERLAAGENDGDLEPSPAPPL